MVDINNFPNGYAMTSDSNCDLTAEMLRDANISCIAMPYCIDGVEYYREPGTDFDASSFYEHMRQGKVVKTMSRNVEDFKTFWRPYLEAGLDVLYLGFTHALSGTFENACIARDECAKEFPERSIKTVDTLLICVPQGALLMLCGRKYKEGYSMDAMIEFVENNRQRFTIVATVESLEYLCRGGRISVASAAIGNLLAIKPMIHITPDGGLDVIAKTKGHKKAMRRMVELTLEHMDEKPGEEDLVFVLDADCPDDAERLEQGLREGGYTGHINRLPVGPVVGAHTGPGTSAICYVGKNRMPIEA